MKRRNSIDLNCLSKMALVAICLFLLAGCKSENDQVLTEARSVKISILHDNDSVLAEWLNSALVPFDEEVATLYPDSRPEISLSQKSTSQSIEELASGKLKVDAVLLPQPGFSEIINGKLTNLGAPLSSCKELIGSPYVAVIPSSQVTRLSKLLGRIVTAQSDQTISVSLQELGLLLNSSWYGYAHPSRSARGQFGLLLSMAAVTPDYFLAKTPWSLAIEKVTALQQHLDWYAPSDTQLLKRISSQNSNPSAAVTSELTLGLISTRQLQTRNELKSSLVILTPSDGTIWETHTLCISEADWVSPIKKSILLKFQEFLASPPMLTKAKAQGFQAVSKDLEFSPKAIILTRAKNELSDETAKILQKPFALSFAMDTSATMPPEALGQMRDFAINIFSSSPPSSKIEYLRFASDVQVLGNQESLKGTIESLLAKNVPSGGSSIYDAIAKQYELLSRTAISLHRRVALIVTDGNDRNSEHSLDDLIHLVSNSSRTKGFISLHMVILSPTLVDIEPLKKIIEAANGTLYETDPVELPHLLAEIKASL